MHNFQAEYCKISIIRRTKSQTLNDSRFAVAFAQSIEARYTFENKDIVGAAQTGDAPTSSDWSTILLHTNVWPILEIWRYIAIDVVTQRKLLLVYDARFPCTLHE